MPRIERRSLLVAALGAPAILASGRSSAQADDRPVITIAVQQIVNANALDTLREQSNVGERVFAAGRNGNIYRFDNGKQIWRASAGQNLSAGVGADAKVVVVGTSKGEVLAFDTESGKPL